MKTNGKKFLRNFLSLFQIDFLIVTLKRRDRLPTVLISRARVKTTQNKKGTMRTEESYLTTSLLCICTSLLCIITSQFRFFASTIVYMKRRRSEIPKEPFLFYTVCKGISRRFAFLQQLVSVLFQMLIYGHGIELKDVKNIYIFRRRHA